MRFIAATFAILTVASTVGQRLMEHTEVIPADTSKTPMELLRVADRWFVDVFKNANSVIQLRDTVAMTIVGKGTGQSIYSMGKGGWGINKPMWYHYTVEVQVKPGRCRLRLYDFTIEERPMLDSACCCFADCGRIGGQVYRATQGMHEDVKTACASMAKSLRQAMVAVKDDW